MVSMDPLVDKVGNIKVAKLWAAFAQTNGPGLKREGKKGVKIKIFGPVFLGFSPEIDPGTPLDRPGAPRTSICTKISPGDQF